MDAKATVIEYFRAYELLFESQQEICKRSDNLDVVLKVDAYSIMEV
jgi:hypothetical protein